MTKRNLVIITGVSCSGKTSLQDELLGRGWLRPLNFTTRKPRDENALTLIDEEGDFSSDELGEYQFIGTDAYFIKLRNGDFLEHTNYGGNWYAVSKFLPEGNICIVLDPVGRAQVLEKIAREGIDVEVSTFFLECSKELQADRMEKRGDTPEEVEKRKNDFKWFQSCQGDMIIDGSWSPKMLADIIEGVTEKTGQNSKTT